MAARRGRIPRERFDLLLGNALLAADALPVLEALQQDDDPLIAERSTVVFQHVIPRIWSF